MVLECADGEILEDFAEGVVNDDEGGTLLGCEFVDGFVDVVPVAGDELGDTGLDGVEK